MSYAHLPRASICILAGACSHVLARLFTGGLGPLRRHFGVPDQRRRNPDQNGAGAANLCVYLSIYMYIYMYTFMCVCVCLDIDRFRYLDIDI